MAMQRLRGRGRLRDGYARSGKKRLGTPSARMQRQSYLSWTYNTTRLHTKDAIDNEVPIVVDNQTCASNCPLRYHPPYHLPCADTIAEALPRRSEYLSNFRRLRLRQLYSVPLQRYSTFSIRLCRLTKLDIYPQPRRQ